MNATRVSVRAGRRPGMLLTIALLLSALMPCARGADIVATLTGTIAAGWDNFPLFNVGPEVPRVKGQRDLKGQAFNLVYRFDDGKGMATPPTQCAGSGSGILLGGQPLPASAVLTIGNVSFTFGTHLRNVKASAWRSVASNCSQSEIDFEVDEGVSPGNNVVGVRLKPANGGRPLTQNPDWRAPLTITGFDWDYSGFAITNGDYRHMANGTFDLKSLTVARK